MGGEEAFQSLLILTCAKHALPLTLLPNKLSSSFDTYCHCSQFERHGNRQFRESIAGALFN
jgi:hypothetical protein